jgi:signal transduction histidine kinase
VEEREQKRILVVDDEVLVRQTLQAMLTACGHQVETAKDGEEALRRITPDLDLVLLDVDLPSIDGFEVTRRIRQDERRSHVPIIIVTAHDRRQDRLRAVEAGATDFIGKPVELAELAIRTTSALRAKKAQDAVRRYQTELEQMVAERTTALVKARDDALAASRAKTAFLARMSHELRTPLNHILGFSEVLLEDAAERGLDEWRSELQTIQRSGEHLLELITEVLEFADAEAGNSSLDVKTFPLADLLSDVTAKAQPLARANGNRLQVEPPASPVILKTDRRKLEAAVIELLKNACAFTRGGIVFLQVQTQQFGDTAWVELRIIDTGPGMVPEQLQQAFEPFWQAVMSNTRSHGGAGLGLTLARHYCELLGGNLTVTSELGSGSVFSIRLPTQLAL